MGLVSFSDRGTLRLPASFSNLIISIPTAIMPSENAQSAKVLDELMQKLTISKEADAIKESAGALASFINGRIEDLETPTR